MAYHLTKIKTKHNNETRSLFHSMKRAQKPKEKLRFLLQSHALFTLSKSQFLSLPFKAKNSHPAPIFTVIKHPRRAPSSTPSTPTKSRECICGFCETCFLAEKQRKEGFHKKEARKGVLVMPGTEKSVHLEQDKAMRRRVEKAKNRYKAQNGRSPPKDYRFSVFELFP